MPKVSIIIPVYNAELYLKECIDSIINQTLTDIEIICINDGSTDSSAQILNEYVQKDSRIVVINQENKGAAVARNKGINIAKGAYLGFVDADDYIENTYYEKLYNATENESFNIAMTLNVKLVEDGYLEEYKSCGAVDTKVITSLKEKEGLLLHTAITWNKIYKTSFIRKNNISFTEINSAGEDLSFTFFSLVLADKISAISDAIYYYRRINSSATKVIKDKKFYKIIDMFQITENKLSKLNINIFKKLYWQSVLKKRRKGDFLNYYSSMHKDCKIEFRELIKKAYPKDKVKEPIKDLIVSLTSYPERINYVHKAIESIMIQPIEPEKIVLALGEDKFPNKEKDLPESILNLQEKGLEILWCKDIRSFTKLIPTLRKYPDKTIVTADDDIIYPQGWLENLYKTYLKKPKMVHCHRAHRVTFDQNKEIINYKNWHWVISNVSPSFNNFLTGVGGVLYPVNIFYKDILKEDLFKQLCPNADDIWFWAMCVLNGTKINVVKNNIRTLKYIDNTQENGLWKTNVNENQNDIQLKKVFDYYPELLKKLDKRKFNPNCIKANNLYHYKMLLKEWFAKNKLKNILNKEKSKILLWGASIFIEDFIKDNKIKNSNIVGIIDRNSNKWGNEIEGYKIFTPEQIKELGVQKVLLTIKHSNELIYVDVKKFLEQNHPEIELLPNIFKN